MLSDRQRAISYYYAWFMVYVLPLALPLGIWTLIKGWVTVYDIILTLSLYAISGLGITVGYHRLTAHRSFQTKPWLKRLLLISGSFAMQGGPANWASIHIQHHSQSDRTGDPHSPVHGFWHSHCSWMFRNYHPNFRHYGKWLLQDKEVRHVTKYYFYYSHLGLLIPLLLGGWIGFLWAGLIRLLVCYHMTWSINSVCHKFGRRPFKATPDHSTNHWLIALMTFGEGWHNNHHRYLQMPYFGHKWYQVDMGKWLIMAFKSFGLAWDLKIPKGG
jgi:stearoyl-CoA desaturase (Delta-9 desaturase)